jgi:putative glutamine amidotransferase
MKNNTHMTTIGMTKTTSGHYPQYADWLLRACGDIRLLDLEAAADPVAALQFCAGLVLVGGPDVDPSHYQFPEAAPLCRIDAARDALEFSAIAEAVALNIPILGLCRGLQVMNVALGGTLIPDLPAAGIPGHGQVDGRDSLHDIRVEQDSLLASIVQSVGGLVNSAHHQSADRIAAELRITASSRDGVVEALEWKNSADRNFLLLVQWHPERLMDPDSPFARGLAAAFLHRCIAQGGAA